MMPMVGVGVVNRNEPASKAGKKLKQKFTQWKRARLFNKSIIFSVQLSKSFFPLFFFDNISQLFKQ